MESITGAYCDVIFLLHEEDDCKDMYSREHRLSNVVFFQIVEHIHLLASFLDVTIVPGRGIHLMDGFEVTG